MSGTSHISKKANATGKRKVEEASQALPPMRLDMWFQDDKHKVDYVGMFGNKTIILPKFIQLQWHKDEGFMLPTLLELVKVFYTTVKAIMDGHLVSTVNGKKMVIDDDV